MTFEKLQNYKNAGINRISIGLQSTSNNLLQQIGRIHTYEQFLQTYKLAEKVGFQNRNVDLMIGLPNQTMKDVESSISQVIALKPTHISVYSFIVEEGTVMQQKIEKGDITLPSEELERKMYWYVKNSLEQTGFTHYEISNFALPGYESKHNMDCWNQKEYVGFGVAAHSYTNGVRYSNIESVENYIYHFQINKQEDNFIFHEKQTEESKQKEFMLLGLRKIEGVSIQDFKQKFGLNPIYLYHNELEKLVNNKLLEIDGNVIKLTKNGIDLANLVWQKFI